MMSINRCIARPDDVSVMSGNSEDHKVTHLQVSDLPITNMGVIAMRYPNIESLELFNCEFKCEPDFKTWTRKRRLTRIMCTPGETADTMFNALYGLHEVEKAVWALPNLIQITWKKL